MFDFFGNGPSGTSGGASSGFGGGGFMEEALKKKQLKKSMMGMAPKAPVTPQPKPLDLGFIAATGGKSKPLSIQSMLDAPETSGLGSTSQSKGPSGLGLNPPRLKANPGLLNPMGGLSRNPSRGVSLKANPDFMAQARQNNPPRVDLAAIVRGQGGAPSEPRLRSDPNLMAETRRVTGNAQPARRPVVEQSVGMPKSKADQEFDAFMKTTFQGIAPEEEGPLGSGPSLRYDPDLMAEAQGGASEWAYDPSRSEADNRVDSLVDRLTREIGPDQSRDASPQHGSTTEEYQPDEELGVNPILPLPPGVYDPPLEDVYPEAYLIPGGVYGKMYWKGAEKAFKLGSRAYRIGTGKPLSRYGPGNHRAGTNLPHYHRQRFDSKGKVADGQGMRRHRPWEKRKSDTSFWDRF